MAAVRHERRARVVELGAGVEPDADPLNQKLESLRRDPLPGLPFSHCSSARQASRAASATSTWASEGSAVEKRR